MMLPEGVAKITQRKNKRRPIRLYRHERADAIGPTKKGAVFGPPFLHAQCRPQPLGRTGVRPPKPRGIRLDPTYSPVILEYLTSFVVKPVPGGGRHPPRQ